MENKKMKLILDIMQLAIEITETTKADIFVSYEGHIDEIKIIIYANGWKKGCECDYNKRIYLDTTSVRTYEDIISVLEEMYSQLVGYKEE